MTDDFVEKLRSLQFQAGRRTQASFVTDTNAKVVEVVNESDGGTAGYHVHHGDGHVDATALAQPQALFGEKMENN